MPYSEERLFGLIDSLTECTGRLSRPGDLGDQDMLALMGVWRDGCNTLKSALDEHAAEIRRSPTKSVLVDKLKTLRSATDVTIATVKGLNSETSDEMSVLRMTQRAVKAYKRK